MNCSSCIHNKVCENIRVAEVVECEDYQPVCGACVFFDRVTDSSGECPYKVYWTGVDDFCSRGTP